MIENTPESWFEVARQCGTDKTGYAHRYWSHFHHLADEPITLLEIGVYKGQSMRMWERLFPKATIHTLDINPDCAQYANPPRSIVTIGSQADPATLEQWADSIAAPIDIIVDDGSHFMEHLKIAFVHLFPKLRPGGTYVLEDLGTCYMPDFGGELRNPSTMMELLKSYVDNLNGQFCKLGNPLAIDQLHFYLNCCFVHKRGAPMTKPAMA